jgi:hypothetical protein
MFKWLKWPKWLTLPGDTDTRFSCKAKILRRSSSLLEGSTYVTLQIELIGTEDGKHVDKKLLWRKLAYSDGLNLSKEGDTVTAFCFDNSDGSITLFHIDFDATK